MEVGNAFQQDLLKVMASSLQMAIFAPSIQAMKRTLNLVPGVLIALATLLTNPAPAQGEGTTRSYGEKITPEGAISTMELAKVMSTTDAYRTKVECEIITSCVKKGCWMDVKLPDGDVMKVRFKDYGFFVPTQGLEGKHAVMQGEATVEVTDVATLRHYAEDAGKSKEEIERITEPEKSLMFLADGVLITD